MRFITLSDEELEMVTRLEKTSSSHIVRLRCNLLKLSNKKLSMKEVARLTEIKWRRIVNFFNDWERAKNLKEKYNTLFIKKRSWCKSEIRICERNSSRFNEKQRQ